MNGTTALATLCICEAKLMRDGLNTMVGPTPLPLTLRDCGLPLALSVNCNVAVRGPNAAGVNTTGMAAVPPFAATVIGRLGVGAVKLAGSAKSPGLAPPKVKPVICSEPFPVFVTVIDKGALGVFRF